MSGSEKVVGHDLTRFESIPALTTLPDDHNRNKDQTSKQQNERGAAEVDGKGKGRVTRGSVREG